MAATARHAGSTSPRRASYGTFPWHLRAPLGNTFATILHLLQSWLPQVMLRLSKIPAPKSLPATVKSRVQYKVSVFEVDSFWSSINALRLSFVAVSMSCNVSHHLPNYISTEHFREQSCRLLVNRSFQNHIWYSVALFAAKLVNKVAAIW